MIFKHTETPYAARFAEAITIRDSQDNQLAILTHIHTKTGGRRATDEVGQTAKFIVRACNSHVDLVGALQAARNGITWFLDELGRDESDYEMLEQIDAALKKAGAL